MSTHVNGAKTAVVLLAEDSPAEQRLAQRALAEVELQCDLHIVSDGKEVMDYLLRQAAYSEPKNSPRPDLMLLDLNMPKLDGRQVLKQVKSNPQLATIPIVVLTTSTQEQDILQSYHLGCNSYINKPVDVHKFIDVMRNLGLYWMNLVQLPPGEGAIAMENRPPHDCGRRLTTQPILASCGGVCNKITDLDCHNHSLPDGSIEVQNVLAAEKRVDCLFLDYHLGAQTGLDVLADIRGAGNDVPVITLTGQGNEAVAVEAMKRGAQDYLSKADLTP